MREFSVPEQQIINKIISIPEIQFRQLFSDFFLSNSRVEIDKDGKIDIYTSPDVDWKSVLRELNLVINLLAYLLNERLIYAYSNAVILPQYSATVGNFQGNGVHTLSYPYNRKLLARVTIRHVSNLFDAYEPLRSLSRNNFIMKEDKRHLQMLRVTVWAVVIALITSTGTLLFQYLEYLDRGDEIEKLKDDFTKLETKVKLLQKASSDTTTKKTRK